MPAAPEPAASKNDPWLIRTAQNQVSRPCSREELRAKVLAGTLEPQDEVCKANSFWIFLHEREELLVQLGVALPKEKPDEVTETETEHPEQGPQGSSRSHEFPEAGTSMLSPHDLRPQPQVQVHGRVESPSIWRGVAWVLVTALLLLIYLVLRTLRTGESLY